MTIDFATLRKRLHIISGTVMGLFILGHFSNHALGLVSVEAMEGMRRVLHLIWRSYLGTFLLYGALLTHFCVALESLYKRRTLRMPWSEAIKIGLGLALPFLLVGHVVGVRVEMAISGYEVDYPDVLRGLWSDATASSRQSLALVIAWVHGCLGFWFYLRGKIWFRHYALLLYSVALLLPILSILGFVSSARLVSAMPPYDVLFVAPRADATLMGNIRSYFYFGFAALIGGTFLLRALPSSERVRITYPDGRVATVNAGFSVLEASRAIGVPHLSICGGRGRCSTCRVRVTEGLDKQPHANAKERATLERIGAPANVRLACQLFPRSDLSVSPVLMAGHAIAKEAPLATDAAGRERKVAVLFCDLRDFTRLTEDRLPFDTVYLLNRYFDMVGSAVEKSGGVIDKFIGDGALAIFGLNNRLDEACAQALRASALIGEGMVELNRSFHGELQQPLRIAMGMHAGTAIVGRIGYGPASELTVVGNTINLASRLESVAKEFNVELAVSAELVDRTGRRMEGHARHGITIRGRATLMETWIVTRAADLATEDTVLTKT